MIKKICFIAFMMLIATIGIGGYYTHAEYQRVIHSSITINTAFTELNIERGTTFNTLLKQLERDGYIKDEWPFKILVKQTPKLANIKAGRYRLRNGEAWLEIFDRLVDGDVVHYKITFVEGWTFKDILRALETAPELVHQLTGMRSTQVLERLQLDISHPEGWFYPDTYLYSERTTDIDILRQSHERMKRVLEQEWNNRDPTTPLGSSYDALILASIIEKETGAPEERGQISGVFSRRLKKGMRLQTDPTVIYGIGDRYNGNIRRSHLREDTPYNTYVHAGLPPSPIASPGRAAIHAALHPEPGTTLYFVALGDGSGRHYFSSSLAEHNRAVRKYLLRRKK